ncbi:MAG TPA: serine hydrolase domain-containing protein, partial [Nocardioidaceae bacterium]|nr:serine hydrolase domain-containing protein [Nocardioidaceae bacterium]
EQQEPRWEPGTAHGESALFFGHLVGELVRRIDGRSLGRFLYDEVCGPRGLTFFVGLDDTTLHRAVDLTGLDARFREELTSGRSALYRQAMGNPPGALDHDVVNGTRWRCAQVPAVNGHGTAESVAGFFAALLTGDLLSPAVLAELATAHCSGPDAVMGGESAWGLGVGVDEDGFGMGGTGGSVGWASKQGGYTFAFLTGHVGTHDRADLLENALRQCLNLAPLS